jgi:phage-related protein
MSPLVQSLITTLVPILVNIAESLLNVTPTPNDPSWVAGLINEIMSLIQKYIPAFLMPSIQEVEALVAAEIEKYI